MTTCLTFDALAAQRKALGPPPRPIAGTIMSPEFYKELKAKDRQIKLGELLLDERIAGPFAHVYYDEEMWRARVKDQNQFNQRAKS